MTQKKTKDINYWVPVFTGMRHSKNGKREWNTTAMNPDWHELYEELN